MTRNEPVGTGARALAQIWTSSLLCLGLGGFALVLSVKDHLNPPPQLLNADAPRQGIVGGVILLLVGVTGFVLRSVLAAKMRARSVPASSTEEDAWATTVTSSMRDEPKGDAKRAT